MNYFYTHTTPNFQLAQKQLTVINTIFTKFVGPHIFLQIPKW